MKKTKPRKSSTLKRENKALYTFLSAQIFAVMCYLSVFFIGAFTVLYADLSTKYDFIFSVVMFTVCSFVTGFYAGMKTRENGIVTGILYSLPMNAVVILTSLIFSDFTADINLAVTAVLLVTAGGIGGILAVNKRLRR